MNWYNSFKYIHKLVDFVGLSPFEIKIYKNNIDFKPKLIKNKSDKIKTLLLTTVCISGIITYLMGNHRVPMIQAYKDQIETKDNLTNKILLYMADCSAYIIVISTFYFQLFMTKSLTTSMKMLLCIESRLRQNGCSLSFQNKRKFMVAAILTFSTDIFLKTYDTFYLAYENLVPFHGIYEHIVRYIFIHFMDLIILQWICFMELLKLYLTELIYVVKNMKIKQCWVVEDFKIPRKYNQKFDNILKDISKIYDQIYTVSKDINLAFSVPFLLIIPICFIIATVTIFSLCKIIKREDKINPFMTIAYMSYMIRMMAIILPPLKVTDTAKKFIAKLHCVHIGCMKESTQKTVSKTKKIINISSSGSIDDLSLVM